MILIAADTESKKIGLSVSRFPQYVIALIKDAAEKHETCEDMWGSRGRHLMSADDTLLPVQLAKNTSTPLLLQSRYSWKKKRTRSWLVQNSKLQGGTRFGQGRIISRKNK